MKIQTISDSKSRTIGHIDTWRERESEREKEREREREGERERGRERGREREGERESLKLNEMWRESEKVCGSFLPCAVHFCTNFLFLRFLLHLLFNWSRH